jgi:hypothetical protein
MRHVSGYVLRGFTYATPYTLAPVLPLTGTTTFLRHPIACVLTSSGRAIHRVRPEGHYGFWRLASLVSAWALFCGYGNINPLSIDYACRPRLRSRLTLGGLAWPRNPWSFGGRVSHSSFATHACILTRVPSTAGLPRRFFRHTTLPYPSAHLASHPWMTGGLYANAKASVVCLSPVTLSARNHLTSELLRTL